MRHDDRNVRLTLVDYPKELYAGELPLGYFRPGDSIPGPYLGPACPVIRSIHTGVDDIGQDRAGTNPILLRIEIEPDDSSRPAAWTYIVQCRQATVAGIKPTATEDDDPVLQGQPDDEYYEQPGTDWQDCGVVERPGVGTLILGSVFSIGERIDIRVIALDDEGRASCWRVYEDYLVELPVAAAPGARLHFGEIDPEAAPDDAIGQNGDRFIADDGRTWVKVDGAWVFQGDFTADDGTKIYSGEVAEDALPPGDIGKEGDLYFAFDGRWWEKTDETTWTLRGDLTGPAGSDIFTGSGDPQAGLGKDGDVYVSDDGIVWRKAGGVWTQTGVDLSGKAGATLHSGEVADGAKPPAGLGNVDDVYFASDGRWWQKTADATWTLRGDLTGPAGSDIFTGSGDPQAGLGKDGDVYVSDDGIVWRKAGGVWTQTGVDLSGKAGATLHSGEVADGAKPPAGLGNVDDVYFASDGRWWQKTADATWTLRGDLTGPAGSDIFTGSGDPQAGLGKDGDVYVSDDGTLWTRANGVWIYSGVDLTGLPGSKIISGDLAEGASPSPSLGNVEDIFFNLDGRVWEKTDDTTWTSRGDITGPPGSSLIPGVVATGELPPANVGNVGDTFLAADGCFWQKTDATTWTYIDDLTGPTGPGGINPRGAWRSGTSYAVSDEVYRNFQRTAPPQSGILRPTVTRYSIAYLCKLAHTADASNAPSGNGNDQWDALLGGGESEDESTTETQTIYRRAASTPATPSGTAEAIPSRWSTAQPSPTATLGVYRSQRTVTNDADGTFESATAWSTPMLVPGQGPTGMIPDPIDPTNSVTRYRLASRTPATPSSSTENPPSSWLSSQPSPHATLSIYKLVGTRTYRDGVFQSAVWVVTLVRGPVIVTTTEFTGYRRASPHAGDAQQQHGESAERLVRHDAAQPDHDAGRLQARGDAYLSRRRLPVGRVGRHTRAGADHRRDHLGHPLPAGVQHAGDAQPQHGESAERLVRHDAAQPDHDAGRLQARGDAYLSRRRLPVGRVGRHTRAGADHRRDHLGHPLPAGVQHAGNAQQQHGESAERLARGAARPARDAEHLQARGNTHLSRRHLPVGRVGRHARAGTDCRVEHIRVRLPP